MRSLVVGLGIQGQKRKRTGGIDIVGTVDTAANADYASLDKVPLDLYDAAMLCVPDQPKIEMLEYLFKHKKHAMVEKPLFSSVDNLLKLKALCAKSKVTCYTAYNHRFEPHFIRMRDTIQSGKLGKIHLIKMFYGNGTARDVRNSEWKDQGYGVLPDLGSHLLDTILFWLGHLDFDFKLWSANRFENKSFDHIHFGSNGPIGISLEATLLSWRNTFRCDIFGDAGSAHIDCLCKWGPSTFTLRDRKLPSGRPDEESHTIISPDPTWEAEYAFFKSDCLVGGTNLDHDILIQRSLNKLYAQAKIN